MPIKLPSGKPATENETLLSGANSVSPEWYKPLPKPYIDWAKWRNVPRLELWQAIALSIGVDPVCQLEGVDRDYDRRIQIAKAHMCAGGELAHVERSPRLHLTPVTLSDIARLAERCSPAWDMPKEFPKAEAAPENVTPATQAAPEGPPAALMTKWSVKKPQRYGGYTRPLHAFLSAAQRDGEPCPTAREVVDAWLAEKPAEIVQVLPEGFNYYDSKGNTKAVDLAAIREAIKRMTHAR